MSEITSFINKKFHAFAGTPFCKKSAVPDQVRWPSFDLFHKVLLYRVFIGVFISENKFLLTTASLQLPLLSQTTKNHDTTC
jgi:hypothetical protein